MAHIGQSRPESGTFKKVKARIWHIQDSQGHEAVSRHDEKSAVAHARHLSRAPAVELIRRQPTEAWPPPPPLLVHGVTSKTNRTNGGVYSQVLLKDCRSTSLIRKSPPP